MSFPEINFQPKGPDSIRARMNDIRSRMEAPRREEFQHQLDQARGTPAPLSGSIGPGGVSSSENLGTLPPANPADGSFDLLKGSIGGKQAEKLQIQGLITQVAREQNIDQSLLRAVVEAESDYNSLNVSRTGAKGLMQLMPDTAKEMGVNDPFSPVESLTGGAKYLNKMIKMYHGDLPMALAAYNAGPAKVKPSEGIPNIPETKAYVNRILKQLGKQ
jgi:soluble lytic murein transglycosylase-like protein